VGFSCVKIDLARPNPHRLKPAPRNLLIFDDQVSAPAKLASEARNPTGFAQAEPLPLVAQPVAARAVAAPQAAESPAVAALQLVVASDFLGVVGREGLEREQPPEGPGAAKIRAGSWVPASSVAEPA
jgi:hypothetical protein